MPLLKGTERKADDGNTWKRERERTKEGNAKGEKAGLLSEAGAAGLGEEVMVSSRWSSPLPTP